MSEAPVLDATALRVKPPKRITVRWLKRLGACENGWKKVVLGEWGPEGAELAPESVLRASELNMNLGWLAHRVLSFSAYTAWETATAPARATWRKVTIHAYAVWREATGPAFVAWREATARADAAWRRAMARALVEILWPQELARG